MPEPATAPVATQQTAVRQARMGLILTSAGLVWLMATLQHTHQLTPRTLTLGSMLGASGLVACLGLLRRAPRLPDGRESKEQIARLRRILVAVNILEWVAVATAVVVLLLLHLPEYIPTAAGIIVGLYLYPVASALRAPLHTVFATLLLVWNVVVLAWLPRTRQMTGGAAGTGCILLAGAFLTLGFDLWRTRRPASPSLAASSTADLLTR